jgi:hypothetical protein
VDSPINPPLSFLSAALCLLVSSPSLVFGEQLAVVNHCMLEAMDPPLVWVEVCLASALLFVWVGLVLFLLALISFFNLKKSRK